MKLPDGLIIYALASLAIHVVTLLIVAWRLLRAPKGRLPRPATAEAITIIRPVSMNDSYLPQTLGSTFGLDWPETRIIFCAARESDPAVPVVRELLAANPAANATLLVGDDPISPNPKLNNCMKGWRAAATDLVAIIDSNVLLPADYVEQMLAPWDGGCGAVTSPPLGAAPSNLWAEIECMFLNSHQARWQLVADEIGLGFGQGKNLLFRRSIIEPLGGLACLAQETAEDAAATKVIRAAGYHIRLARAPFPQPLGARTLREMWARQVRWARLRRVTFTFFFLPEIFSGALLPGFAMALAAWLGASIGPLKIIAFLLAWYGLEFGIARAIGWANGVRSLAAMVMRDAMLPIVWIAGLSGNKFTWQGHIMSAETKANEGVSRRPS